jgi:hypothetical protein
MVLSDRLGRLSHHIYVCPANIARFFSSRYPGRLDSGTFPSSSIYDLCQNGHREGKKVGTSKRTNLTNYMLNAVS